MKLFLSSFRLTGGEKDLVRLLGDAKRACIIMNAVDFEDTDTKAEKLTFEKKCLQALGLASDELDLRTYFNGEAGLRSKLLEYDFVWVRGGNAFLLRKAMTQSGADTILKELITEEKIIYGGYSAGVCVLAPTLRGLDLVDDEHVTADGYQDATVWDGLDILPFSVAPHYKSDHPESAFVDKYVAYLKKNKLPYETLSDGESVVIGA
jgi:dipeptidase E